MGKWLTRLAALDQAEEEKTPEPPYLNTDKTVRTSVLSVLSVSREGGSEEILLSPHHQGWGWDEAAIARFHARRARLLRWGWPADQAEALADRLTCRDVAGGDDRVNCAGECAYYRPGRCGNHQRAGLHSPEVSHDLAGMLQRCPGFSHLEG